MPLLHILFLVGLIAFSILAVLAKDLLKAAISLAVASIFLALIFFRLNAYYVGAFEISVVAGLITVLFVTTINLTHQKEKNVEESKWPKILFPLFFILMLLIDYLLMKKISGRVSTSMVQPETGTFGQVLWGQRTFDLVGQIGVIFAGVFSVLALFRKGGKHE